MARRTIEQIEQDADLRVKSAEQRATDAERKLSEVLIELGALRQKIETAATVLRAAEKML